MKGQDKRETRKVKKKQVEEEDVMSSKKNLEKMREKRIKPESCRKKILLSFQSKFQVLYSIPVIFF